MDFSKKLRYHISWESVAVGTEFRVADCHTERETGRRRNRRTDG